MKFEHAGVFRSRILRSTGAMRNASGEQNEGTYIGVRSRVGDGSRVFSRVSEAWHCPHGLDPE